VDWSAQGRLEEDLVELRQLGVKLDLLLNANCYGRLAISRELEATVASVLDHLGDVAGGADLVTTTSPAVAHMIKTHYPQVEVRASVNMRIGTVQGMTYLADLFDSYYVLRDLNRDPAALRRIKAWCEANDKGLCLLANSGCLYSCSGQTFHDNLVAHECEIAETENIEWLPHTCWRLFRDPANWAAILQSTWIRPEDLHHYAGLFDVVKLATRMHAHPRLVIDAYVSGEYRGNLLDLFEPGFGPALAPQVIDATRMPDDWFEQTSTCGHRCETCDYCERALQRAMIEVT